MSTRQADRAVAPQVGAPGEEILTYDEIVERYYGESILMRITEDDEDGWPWKGVVLAHSHDDGQITEAIRSGSVLRRGPDGRLTEKITWFLAYPRISSGPELDAAVAAFAAGLIKAASKHRDATAN